MWTLLQNEFYPKANPIPSTLQYPRGLWMPLNVFHWYYLCYVFSKQGEWLSKWFLKLTIRSRWIQPIICLRSLKPYLLTYNVSWELHLWCKDSILRYFMPNPVRTLRSKMKFFSIVKMVELKCTFHSYKWMCKLGSLALSKCPLF